MWVGWLGGWSVPTEYLVALVLNWTGLGCDNNTGTTVILTSYNQCKSYIDTNLVYTEPPLEIQSLVLLMLISYFYITGCFRSVHVLNSFQHFLFFI